jgi:hypothetical protein
MVGWIKVAQDKVERWAHMITMKKLLIRRKGWISWPDEQLPDS